MDDVTSPKIIQDIFSIEDNFNDIKWEPFKDGVEISRLYGDDNGEPSAALLKYAAGAEVPNHTHSGHEHILVLSGSQTDGVQVYDKGTLIISVPGSQHSIASENGCIVLAIWNKPVEFTTRN